MPYRKYHTNKTEEIQNSFSAAGCGSLRSARSTKNPILVYTEALRHRRKPRRLLPTPLDFYSSEACVPFDEYECKAWPCSTYFGQGSFTFTHNAQTYSIKKSYGVNSAKKNTYSLLAGSGFTSNIANYGESLASLSETGKMIHRRARQVAEIAKALKSRNFGHLEKILNSDLPARVLNSKRGKELASGWLELEFGWKPLVQDVYSAVDLYRNTIVKHGQLVTSPRFGDKFERRTSMRMTPDMLAASSDRVSSKAYGIVSNPNAFTLNQLGLINPALLAWQLLPFSFVVDWFLPISRILGHLTNRVGISAYVICTVSEETRANKWSCGNVWGQNRKRVYRQVSSSVFPNVTTLSPRSLGLWHATAASALVAQSFGRPVR